MEISMNGRCDSGFSASINESLFETDMYNLPEYINALNDEKNAESIINCYGKFANKESEGKFVKHDNNKFGIILGKDFSPIVYRGLNNDLCFMPTSLRYELFDGKERIRHSLEWIKKKEFLSFILSSPYFERTNSFKFLNDTFNVNLEAIAKLYNFVSDYIDVTRNIMVAYFYAYTYIDKEKKQILPITDFNMYSPTLYTGNLKRLYYETPDSVCNLSFQPFIRAKIQESMSIKTSENYDSVKKTFIKTDLPRNPKIAEKVYNMFDGGKALMPGESIAKYSIMIKGEKTISEQFFEQYCKDTGTDKDWLLEEITDLGYELTNTKIEVPDDVIHNINREIDEIIIPFINSKITI